MHHPDECGPCTDCAEALEYYELMVRRNAAELELLNRAAYWSTVSTIAAE